MRMAIFSIGFLIAWTGRGSGTLNAKRFSGFPDSEY